MAERYRSQVAFLGLNSRDERGAAEAFLEQHPVGYPSVFDEHAEQARSIGAGTGWPTTIYFDADDNVTFVRQGGYALARVARRRRPAVSAHVGQLSQPDCATAASQRAAGSAEMPTVVSLDERAFGRVVGATVVWS